MPFLITTRRILRASLQNFTRNLWLAVSTVFVLFLSLASVNILLGVNALLTNAGQRIEDRIDVSVYFAPKTPDAILEQAKFFMSSLPQVRSVELFGADVALEQFKTRHADDPKILGALAELDENPLGGSLVIKARNTGDYPFLLEALKNPQFSFAVQSKSYDDHADLINRVRDITRSVQIFGTGLILIFALFSVLLVYNTIRVAIYTQRDEIGMMRLVGASGAYVRWPFVLEGIFLAALALALCAGFVAISASYLDPRLAGVFDGGDPGLVRFFSSHAQEFLFAEGGGLAALVALSSWAAVGKYLKR